MESILYYWIPVFTFFYLSETLFFIKRKLPYFTWKDSFTSLTMGLGYLGIAAIAAGFTLSLLSFFFEHRLFEIPRNWKTYVLFIFLEDLTYYVFHRVSHECRLWWVAHETHHSSEFYNFSTALRQTWTGPWYGWIFWIPLVILGFPVEWIVLQSSISLIYQFFIHTELVKTLGPLEWVMNTPSHHRVHHGINPLYLDRNYAGIFIIWDRLFGTFEPEVEKPLYGVTHPLKTYNPLFVGFHTWMELWTDLSQASCWGDRINYLLRPPGWSPRGDGELSTAIRAEYLRSSEISTAP